MSKDTPEVGDIYLDTRYNLKFVVIKSRNNLYDIFTENLTAYLKFGKGFTEYSTYLGKSKANIDDLFKTENEE